MCIRDRLYIACLAIYATKPVWRLDKISVVVKQQRLPWSTSLLQKRPLLMYITVLIVKIYVHNQTSVLCVNGGAHSSLLYVQVESLLVSTISRVILWLIMIVIAIFVIQVCQLTTILW